MGVNAKKALCGIMIIKFRYVPVNVNVLFITSNTWETLDDESGRACCTCLDGYFTQLLTVWAFCSRIDFKIRTIELDGKKIKLQIWDTAGQERFRTITTAYYRGAMGIMLVYDITNEKSFDNIKNWIRNIEEHASSDVERMILGNKCDMNDKRQVSKERGEKLAIDYGIKFLETSAKSSTNVEENDSNSSGAGGPVKITENRSKKTSFFRCSLL
ncbi:hypothetical protein U0070_026944 [Myodes glareolus]|uniref:small monomeric GTPase n=1 Tax=Myodes glareolus TaxID=447135 RepID=A0AAW0K1Y9_MYOGA